MTRRAAQQQMVDAFSALPRSLWVDQAEIERIAHKVDVALEAAIYAVAEAHSKQVSDVVGYARQAFVAELTKGR